MSYISNAIYGYYVNLDERGEFKADVRDTQGKTVFRIDGYDLIEDGFMRRTTDTQGLTEYLVSVGIIDCDAEIIPMHEFEAMVYA